jgi:hypothetical protein
VAFTASGTIPLVTVNSRSVPDFTNGPYLQAAAFPLTQDMAHVFAVVQVDTFAAGGDYILMRVNRASTTSWAGCLTQIATFNRATFFEREGGAGGNVYRSNTDALVASKTYLLEFKSTGTTNFERGFWINGKKQNVTVFQELDTQGLWWTRPSTATHTQVGSASFDSAETTNAFDGRICQVWAYQGVVLSDWRANKNRLYAKSRWDIVLD